jgi:hypothetical protein
MVPKPGPTTLNLVPNSSKWSQMVAHNALIFQCFAVLPMAEREIMSPLL